MHTFSDSVCILYGSFQHFSHELCAYPLHLVLQLSMLEGRAATTTSSYGLCSSRNTSGNSGNLISLFSHVYV